MGYFNLKTKEILLRELTYNFVVNSNERKHRKSGHVELEHVETPVPSVVLVSYFKLHLQGVEGNIYKSCQKIYFLWLQSN